MLYEGVAEKLLRLKNSEEYVQELWEAKDLDDVEAGTLKKHLLPATISYNEIYELEEGQYIHHFVDEHGSPRANRWGLLVS